ncbi:MAG: RecX family transcriptional regulator [Oscillospiraceae bacterium]|nr:RecX family transcriptional regulator [Oscillospiraceae bacterium]
MLNNIKITDITRTKKGFNALFAGEEFLFSVDDVVLYKNNIQIGSCFTQQELACISKQSLDTKAVDKAYALLSSRMHSRKELYDKLLRKFEPENARYAVNKMEELGLVDDAAFAQMKAEYLLNVKKQSFSAIKMKLASLGIDKDIIDSVLLSFELDNQTDDITRLLQTKYSSKLSQPEKVVASLLRKGFKYGEIKQAMNNLQIDLQEY